MNENKLFSKNFNLVVIGQIISLFGNAILRFALPLYLLRVTGSPALFGMVSACSFLPMIVLSLLGGVLADRVNKRNIMVALDFSTAALILILYLVLGKLPIVPLFIAVLMILYGIQGVYQPAVQASIPILVSSDKIMSGNAIINQINSLSGLLGPIIGGMLYGAFGINPILIISTICFTLSAIMEIFIRMPHTKRKTDKKMLAIVTGDLKESFKFMKREKPVFFRAIALVASFNLFVTSMLMVGHPILIVNNLNLSNELLGFSQGIIGIGGLTGGILTAILGKKISLKKTNIILLLCGLLALPISLSVAIDIPAMAAYTIISISGFFIMVLSTMFSILIISAIQMQTPPDLIGKVLSCMMAISMCAQPIGQSLYGLLFENLADKPWIIILFGAIVGCIISFFSKHTFKNLEKGNIQEEI